MGASLRLRVIECLPTALRACNKRSSYQFTIRSFAVLVSLYNACENGQTMTRSALVERLFRMANIDNKQAGFLMVWRLMDRGIIETVGQGRGSIVSPTMEGRNYVRAVERYLRNLRPGSY